VRDIDAGIRLHDLVSVLKDPQRRITAVGTARQRQHAPPGATGTTIRRRARCRRFRASSG
jgi:hypothetical protein